jgi:hypothetical protein
MSCSFATWISAGRHHRRFVPSTGRGLVMVPSRSFRNNVIREIRSCMTATSSETALSGRGTFLDRFRGMPRTYPNKNVWSTKINASGAEFVTRVQKNSALIRCVPNSPPVPTCSRPSPPGIRALIGEARHSNRGRAGNDETVFLQNTLTGSPANGNSGQPQCSRGQPVGQEQRGGLGASRLVRH